MSKNSAVGEARTVEPDRVLSLYAVARRLGAHVDTLHLLCLREGVSIERDEQGARCVLAADVGRLALALDRWRARPRLTRRKAKGARR